MDIINFTNTSMGKRFLKFNLCNPLCDPKIINDRYNKIEDLNNVILIATEELRQRKTPFIIKREIGINKYEYWKIEILLGKTENGEKNKYMNRRDTIN